MDFINKIKHGGGLVFIEKISNWAGAFSGQRHLSAVRESFVALMPLIIAASLFILINNVLLNGESGLVGFLGLEGAWVGHLQEIGIRVYNGTLNILAFLATMMISYRLANSYGEEGITYTIFSLACLFVLFPVTIPVTVPTGEVFQVSGLISGNESGAAGMFVGIFVALISTELFRKVSASPKLKITLADSVPPSVSRSFNVLIPMILVLTLLSIFAWSLTSLFNKNIHEIVTLMIQAPLQNILQGLSGVIGLLLTQNGLWWAGIHGASIMYPITETTLLVAIQENTAAFKADLEIPHIVTKPFLDAFGFMGGGGQTIGLLIALWIAAKKSEHRAITRLATPGMLFNINEPIIFGLPVMFNPVLIVPFLFTPIISIVIAYAATAMDFINHTYVLVPWTTPPVVSAFLATGGDWRAAVLSVFLIGLSVIIYLPFVIVMNKQK
ncbi:PTS transporter subunit EIIC [Enterobacter kobei]|uniref:PTS sugar transporter subunit IIC n=1 Tax=Enterobacter TaxID=547 RepID=UPI000D9E1BAB|nr:MULTISPECIES: PTS transporter subunit EIIC [Enterobacter]MBH0125004.1 PTS sugar transporter subunit IIC [Enterobacter sp. SECR18-0236]PYZ35008.1 PTS sugar transporter subunit IIC [Enterobacter cloacae complex sp.]QMT07434.1 PTS sugar transporter subunit IIC [Enterobacter kobei]RAY68146.1 PTS sugar transporter subunit IIC [Enterobacter kobei]HBM0948547.1 PTS sugar transporter subunit IIC [Enterobacter kobei]